MEPFERLTSALIPILYNDIDTDQIIPAIYLKVTGKEGLAEGLFARWRYLPDGSPNPDFPLNQARYQGRRILLAGDNFGCGSSREHAPWALMAWNIRAVISTSFADIFRNNALKNGLLPVQVDRQTHARLVDLVEREVRSNGDPQDPVWAVTIDLASQTLSLPDGSQAQFPIEAFHKTCLLKGLDSLGYLLGFSAQIEAYERSDRAYPYGVKRYDFA
ncbi:MAG: 3-isopropylmalate dehydratase small subunit [Anaerolineales bacterium]|nr:3-isopropylmalate dehydratase small subunit [Anaerolineales bacterium]MCS7248285.1 3-isopropylmalate dehydratase small subunit [Anaerolineales bacterium]MDW8162099.1 3-isopropylmalate dehydratase small subunit [Anaerolineales bacterium]MDW8447412.1 3-isopropylmalate dehydratase small subunit [Anaerolineales bacterium]